jgi:maltose alpha-D-glucosyltransferase / alpha-amylase
VVSARSSRQAPSSLRDFYGWSDTDQKFPDTRIIFVDAENSNWAWDPVSQAYFWHRFYSHQPDLNLDNPRVFQAVVDVMRLWLDLGVGGMRLDAVPYLIEREGPINGNLPEAHEILKRLRKELDKHSAPCCSPRPINGLKMYCNIWEGDECHMALHFPLMPRIYMAVSTDDRHPITDIIR